MFRIIDKADTGKTKKLMKEANANGGILVCKNPDSMRAKSVAYNLSVGIMSYQDYMNVWYDYQDKPIYIDELESFVKSVAPGFAGYSMTKEN